MTCVLGEGAAPICTSGGGNIERMSGQDVITEEAEHKNTYYYYMRWIWIQYPWLAMQWLGQSNSLNKASFTSDNPKALTAGDNTQQTADHPPGETAGNLETKPTSSNEPGNVGGTGAISFSRGTSSIADARRQATMQRTWTMRKAEALGQPVEMSKSLNASSLTRMNSLINAGMSFFVHFICLSDRN